MTPYLTVVALFAALLIMGLAHMYPYIESRDYLGVNAPTIKGAIGLLFVIILVCLLARLQYSQL